MLRASWASLMARKLRLFMSAAAVILGVAFVLMALGLALWLDRRPRAAAIGLLVALGLSVGVWALTHSLNPCTLEPTATSRTTRPS